MDAETETCEKGRLVGNSSAMPGAGRAKLVVIAMMTALVGFVLLQRAATAAGTQAGIATIVMSDQITALNAGGSKTSFAVKLPPQAHCSGDTAMGGFNVYSYIAPVSVDPGSLTFDSANGPNNNAKAFPLIDTFGTPYNAANTAPNTGAIYPSGPPTFDFSVFTTVQLPPGDYNVGIECATKTGAADVYFNVVLTFTASAADTPGGFVWAVKSATGGTTTTSLSGTTTTTAASASTTSTSTTSSTTGSTSTTSTSTTSTTASSSTTSSSIVVASTGAADQTAQLATTGSSSMTLYDWGVTLVIAGIVLLLAAKRRDETRW